MSVLGADFRRDLEIRRYPVLVYALAPLVALVLQAWLPRVLWNHVLFDLPLVVTDLFCPGPPKPHPGHADGRRHGTL